VQHRRYMRRQFQYTFVIDKSIDFDRNRGYPVFLMEFSRIADDLKGTGCHARLKRYMGLARGPCPLKALYGFGAGRHARLKRYMGLARGAMPRWPLFQSLGHETRLMTQSAYKNTRDNCPGPSVCIQNYSSSSNS